MTTSTIKENSINELPIGVFDSGLGGLTVVREIMKKLPHERIIYLGDSARVPYGTRSASTVERYAWACSDFLVKQGLKMLVVACNTASAVAMNSLRDKNNVPVMGVITAGARAAVNNSKQHVIGVIGTSGTVGSGAYVKEIAKLNSNIKVFQNPAPLLVPLAEEGWIDGPVPRLAINKYVFPLVEKGIDVLLLGCTHYPILLKPIREELKNMNSNTVIVDSATAMAEDIEATLIKNKIACTSKREGDLSCFVTDLPSSFSEVAERFLGKSVGHVEKVDIVL